MPKYFVCLLIYMSVFSVLLVEASEKEKGNATRDISIDVKNVSGKLDTFFKASIGAGRANEGLRADWQKQLAEIKKDSGFQYIRMHGLLVDDMGVYKIDELGKERYNFQYIDSLYDFLLSINMKPFVELSFMPSALASGEKTIFWWRGNVTPPYSYEKWENLIYALVSHWTERYGEKELESWYFEVWNEPNLDGFWAGTQEEYFKLYAHTAKAIKRVNKAYRVGGPATAGAAWVPELIQYCQENKIALDFVSTHAYGVKQGFLDEYGGTGTVLAEEEDAVSREVLNSHKQIANSSSPDLELHFTEWSASYTPADPIHDSYHSAAYILQKLKQVTGSVQSMSYWVFTDIFEEAAPRFEAFHGGFGLMNTQDIKKPAYFSYKFLNQLESSQLEVKDSMSIATMSENGSVQLLFWDYSYTLPDNTNNQQYFNQNLPAKYQGEVNVNIKNLKKGTYRYEVFQVGYEKNDAYTAYIKMGSPNQLSTNEVEALKSIANGHSNIDKQVNVGADGEFSVETSIRENDVYLLKLSRQ